VDIIFAADCIFIAAEISSLSMKADKDFAVASCEFV